MQNWKPSFIRVGIALREIRNNRLYRAKYSTWKEYLRGEWDLSKSYGEYQINAATVVENLQLNVHNCGHSETEKSHNCSTSEIEKGHNCASFEKEGNIKMSTNGGHSEKGTPSIPLPKNERQARPLTLLPTPEHQTQAWQKTLEQTEGKVTALAVSRVVDEMLEELKAQERQEIKDNLASVSGDTLAAATSAPKKETSRKGAAEPKVVEVPEEFTEQYNKLIDILDMYRRAGWKGFNRKLAIEYLEAIKDFLK